MTKTTSTRKLTGSEARREVALKDQVNQLTKQLRVAQREANGLDIIREVVGVVASAQRSLPDWIKKAAKRERFKPDPEVPVTTWADWHLGEVVESASVNGVNKFNRHIARERVQKLFAVTTKLCRHNHTGTYPGIVVNCVGDNVSGGLHPELKATDDLEAIPAAIECIDWMAGGISRFADEFGKVYVPFVPGNHGRNTPRPEFKRYNKKNFDYLIGTMLQRHFADDPRVTIDIRDSNEVLYRVFNMRYLLTHGDMLGVKGGDGIIGSIGPIMRGQVKKSAAYAQMGRSFDKLVCGHYHQELWLPKATVSNTLKGYCEYAKNALGATPTRPSQSLWFVHNQHGETAHWSIYVDKPSKSSPEWLSISGAN